MRLARARAGGGHHGGRDGADASERPAPRYPGAVMESLFRGARALVDGSTIHRSLGTGVATAGTLGSPVGTPVGAAQPLAPGAGDTHRIAIPRARGPGAETAGSWASVKRGPQAQRTVDLACLAARSPGNGDRVGIEVVRRQVEPCACRPDWETRRRGAVATGPASVTMRLTLEVAAQVGGPRSIRCPGWRTLPAPDDPSRLVATRDGTGRPARPDAPTPPHG